MLEAARHSVGVRINPWETRELNELAARQLEQRKAIARCRKELKRLTQGHEVIDRQTPALGRTTACVLWMCQGDPRDYGSAAAYRKAMGLNLTERSSGKYQGKLRISKRGPNLSRKWLFFAAMRQMRDPAVKRWTEKKKSRDGGKGMRAVVAVMRKLSLAAWHVAVHDVKFDAGQLFPDPRTGRAAKAGGAGGNACGKKDRCAGDEHRPLPPGQPLSAAPGTVKVPPHEYMGSPPSGRSTLTVPDSAQTFH